MAKGSRAKILKKTDKTFANSTEKMITFLELYVEGGDPAKAWIGAGYSPSNTPIAMRTIRDNFKLVEKLITNKIGRHVPFAVNGVIELATNAKNDAVKLKALQDILFRAGYDRPMEIVTSEKTADEMSNTELDTELTRLLARVNNEAAEAATQKELH